VKKGISGLTVVRNAVKLGYPLYYSVKSVIDACDEFVISEGFSEDSTMEIVRDLVKEYPEKIRVVHEVWKPSRAGETIAEVTNNAMSLCKFNWIYYIQADEIVHEDNLDFIASVPSGFRRYRAILFRFTHFRPSLLFEAIGGSSYVDAIRMVRNYSQPWRRRVRTEWAKIGPRKLLRRRLGSFDPLLPFMDAFSSGDGWTFYGNIYPRLRADFLKPIFHVGYVSRDRNVVVQKLESHARLLYPTSPVYRPIAEAIRSGRDVESWQFQGLEIIPYYRGDYPRLLLDWATLEGIEYAH
jgi:hypothetical protein